MSDDSYFDITLERVAKAYAKDGDEPEDENTFSHGALWAAEFIMRLSDYDRNKLFRKLRKIERQRTRKAIAT